MTDADLHAIASGTDKRHSPWHEAQELACLVLSLRADLETAKRLASGFAEEYRTAQAELAACRHDLQTCAEKLAVASGHLGIVAARQPERFWTRTPPSGTGWWWHRCDGETVVADIIAGVYYGDGFTSPTSKICGEWAGPLTPPTLVAPEEDRP